MSDRIKILEEIINLHIIHLSEKETPMLSDTKTLTELLKAILVLEQVKKLTSNKSEYDYMSIDDLEDRLNNMGE